MTKSEKMNDFIQIKKIIHSLGLREFDQMDEIDHKIINSILVLANQLKTNLTNKEDIASSLKDSIEIFNEEKIGENLHPFTEKRKIINVFTDGSFKSSVNDKVAGWAFYCPDLGYSEFGLVNNPVSRQIDGEIEAVKKAIEWFDQLKDRGGSVLNIIYDYEGIEKWPNNQWKTNKPLTIQYKAFVTTYRAKFNIGFEWTKGHDGNDGNEIADSLACEAVMKSI